MSEGQWGVRGPCSPPSSLDGITRQRQASTSDKGRIPLPLQKHLFQFVGLLIPQMPDCSRNVSYFPLQKWNTLLSLLCRQSEIKADASGLGVDARRRRHLPFTPRLLAARSLARHIPQQRELPRVIIHQNEAFMAHQKTMNCGSERSVRNVK